MALEKPTEKKVGPLRSLSFSDKTDELEQIDNNFPQNLVNGLILDRLKKIEQLQDNVKLKNWIIKQKAKNVIFQ